MNVVIKKLTEEGVDVTYDFYLGGVSLHVIAGGTFQLVFDKNWKIIGTRGGPGVGGDMGLFIGVTGLVRE